MLLQRERIRGPVAERQAPWPGGGDQGALAVPGRVDTRVQGTLRGATVCYLQRQVRGYLGQRTPRRLRI